jgi:uncharacterized protein
MKGKAIVVLLLCIVAPYGAVAAPATEKSIRELLVLTGAGNLGAQIVQNVLPALKKALPSAPNSFWDDFMKDVRSDELITLIIPIYQRNLSEEDVQAALRFYRTPTGQRLVTALPAITQQSVQAGQEWGQALAQRATAKFQSTAAKTP